MNIKLLVVYHKKAKLIKSSVYTPVGVGMFQKNKKDYSWLRKNTLCDDTGDNISEHNPYSSEFTALYWGWKNQNLLDNPEYIGLVHYRRHFIFNEEFNNSNYTWLKNTCFYLYDFIDKRYRDLIKTDSIDSICNGYDIITTRKYDLFNSLNIDSRSQIIHLTDTDGMLFDLAMEYIKKYYPDYVFDVDDLVNNSIFYQCTLSIMKKELFNKYCEFVFDVESYIYEIAKAQNFAYSSQKRAIAFILEYVSSLFIVNFERHYPSKVNHLNSTYLNFDNSFFNFLFHKSHLFLFNTICKYITFQKNIKIFRKCIYKKEVFFNFKKITIFNLFSFKKLYFELSKEIPCGSKIIIYGAGTFGFLLYQLIYKTKIYNITDIYDKEYNLFNDLRVKNPSKIQNDNFDYVIVTAVKKDYKEIMRRNLIDKGINEEKIVYFEKKVKLKTMMNFVYSNY